VQVNYYFAIVRNALSCLQTACMQRLASILD